MKKGLKYIVRDRDRHGNLRLYFRKPGQKKIRLRGPEGTPNFLQDYRLALMGHDPRPSKTSSLKLAKEGSLRELTQLYFQSAAFKGMKPETQRVRRQVLERFCMNNGDGDKPFAMVEPHHLMKRRDAKIDTPAAANDMIKALRQVYKYAVEYNLHDKNPAASVKNLPSNPDGFKAWMKEDIEKFEETHPIGTIPRLALALALFTGQRRSDLVKLGKQHIRHQDGMEWFFLRQVKGQDRKPVDLWIPIDPELADIIEATPTGDLAFIQNSYGKPFTAESFGNNFRDWSREAGIVGKPLHGLRKAASAMLAENGCTEQEIMAITGHSTSKEVIRYTRSARQKERALNASKKMSSGRKP